MRHAVQPAKLQNWMHNFKAPLPAFRPNQLTNFLSTVAWNVQANMSSYATVHHELQNFHATLMPSKAAVIGNAKHFCLNVK